MTRPPLVFRSEREPSDLIVGGFGSSWRGWFLARKSSLREFWIVVVLSKQVKFQSERHAFVTSSH
jgi:hypothetical protein